MSIFLLTIISPEPRKVSKTWALKNYFSNIQTNEVRIFSGILDYITSIPHCYAIILHEENEPYCLV